MPDTQPRARLLGWRGHFSNWNPGDQARAAMRAGVWSGLGFASSQALRMGSRLAMTHVLPQSAFGVWATLGGLQAGLQMLSDVGIGPSIIQNPRGEERVFLNTAFSIQAARGVLVWLFACAVALPFAHFLGVDGIARLIPFAAMGMLITGFSSTSVWTLGRRMQLRPATLVGIVSEVVGACITLLWGLLSRDVWAFIAGSLATSTILAIGSWLISDRKDRFGWDRAAATALVHFGIGTFLSTATWFLASQGERFVLTRQFTSRLPQEQALSLLGVLSMALMLSSTPGAAFSQAVSQVLFPSISRALRDSPAAALRQYQKSRLVLLAANVLLILFLGLCGQLIVNVLLPPQWSAAGWMLRLLTLRAILDVSQTLPSVLLMSAARLKTAVIANCVRVAALGIGVPFAYVRWDITGAVWALSLLSVPSYIVFIVGLRRDFRQLIKGEVGVLFTLVLLWAACLWVVH